MNKYDLLIAGAGGQGTILASKIISRVALAQNLEVKTAETHGMAQRGGSVVTHVRIGPRVYSPLVPLGDADFLLSFEQLEALRWLPYLSPRGTVITADLVLEPLPVLTGREEYPADALEQIKKAAYRTIVVDTAQAEPLRRNPRTLNMVLLGILAALLPFPRECWEEVIRETLPPRLLEINQAAFRYGLEFMAE